MVEQAIRVLSNEDPTERSPPGVVNTVAPRRRVSRLLALATVYRSAKGNSDAEATLTIAAELTADSPGPARRGRGCSARRTPTGVAQLGELLYDRGRFRDAAAKFEDGWKRFPSNRCCCSSPARRWCGPDSRWRGTGIELSHRVELGNERVRGKFLEELVRRGEAKAAAP